MMDDFGRRFAWICSFFEGIDVMNHFGIGGCDEALD